MSIRTSAQDDYLRHLASIAEEVPLLDLTRPTWRLRDGEASVVIGVDVTQPGFFRTDLGRKPVGVSLDESDRPVTSVETLESASLVIQRISFKNRPGSFNIELTDDATYDPSDGTIQTDSGGIFTNYFYRWGDFILIHYPSLLRGAHPILSKEANDTIKIRAGLTSVSTGVGKAVIDTLGKIRLAGMEPATGILTSNAIVKLPGEYARTGPWPSDLKGALVIGNGSLREGSLARFAEVKSVSTYAQKDDALEITVDSLGAADTKHFILGFVARNFKGFLVSNGRKFWLQQNGVYKLMMDLGDDVFLGVRWRSARIAANRFLLVTSKYAPRVLHLNTDPLKKGEVSGDETLAGCIAPRKPRHLEFIREIGDGVTVQTTNPSWIMAAKGSGGSMTVGENLRVLIRAVNLEDSIASDFVPVVAAGSGFVLPPVDVFTVSQSKLKLTVVEGDRVSVFPASNDTTGQDDMPPFHSRITHIQVWRTRAAESSVFFLETQMELGDMDFVEDGDIINLRRVFRLDPQGAEEYPIRLSDNDVSGLPLLLDSDRESGGLPPICRDVASLLGVTLCFGKADGDFVKPSLFSRDFYGTAGRYVPATGRFTQTGLFNHYVFKEGDRLVVTDGGTTEDVLRAKGSGGATDGTTTVDLSADSPDLSAVVSGDKIRLRGRTDGTVTDSDEFEISSADNGAKTVVVDTAPATTTTGVEWTITGPDSSNAEASMPKGDYEILDTSPNGIDIINIEKDISPLDITRNSIWFYIKRAVSVDWPVIESDEDVWYSRTDTFGPENFPPRVLSLSRTGDIFRRAIRVGDYVAVIMDKAVHILFLSGGELRKNTIHELGAGTPWPDSVLVVGETLYWATVRGIQILTVTPEADDTGRRGRLISLDSSRFTSWFKEAFDEDQNVDAAFDPFNQALRFRRKLSEHNYETLQYGFRTKRWSILEDDNGGRYSLSSFAGKEELTSRLYSVDFPTGAVFEVNYPGSTHPYDGKTVQDKADLLDYIVKGRSLTHRSKALFDPSMVGDIIRFRVNDVEIVRTILKATSRKITFDLVPELGSGDEFVIGATRFRIRFAPFTGSTPDNTKTLREVTVRAHPGSRKADSKFLVVRAYTNLNDEGVESEDFVDVFEDGDAGKTSEDRISSVEAQGNRLEVEIVNLDARNDLDLESLTVMVLEEASQTVDAE